MNLTKELMNFKKNAKHSLTNPAAAAGPLAQSATWKSGVIVFAIGFIISWIFSVVAQFAQAVSQIMGGVGAVASSPMAGMATMGALFGPLFSILLSPVLFIFALVFNIIGVGIIWALGRLMGGKAAFDKLWGALQTPLAGFSVINGAISAVFLILGSFFATAAVMAGMGMGMGMIAGGFGILGSLFGMLIGLYMVYVAIVFVREIHGLTMMKATISVLLPVIIIVGIIMIFAVIMAALVGTSIMAGMQGGGLDSMMMPPWH